VLRRRRQWDRLASWLERYQILIQRLQTTAPAVSQAVGEALAGFCTSDFIALLATLVSAGGEERESGEKLLRACGAALVPGFSSLCDDPVNVAHARTLMPMLSERAADLGPALARAIGTAGPSATGALTKLLGFAGEGYESAIGGQLLRSDERVRREALRALGRIGTPRAASIVAERLNDPLAGMRRAAAETLCRFPAAVIRTELCDLLERHDFVLRCPREVLRLLDRAAEADNGSGEKTADLDDALAHLERLRFRFWNRSAMQVVRKARELRHR